MMLIAQWVVAATGLITALLNAAAVLRHGRRDEARFSEHAKRLTGLENGKAEP